MPLTVSQLIKRLSKFDGDVAVEVGATEDCTGEIEVVKLVDHTRTIKASRLSGGTSFDIHVRYIYIGG